MDRMIPGPTLADVKRGRILELEKQQSRAVREALLTGDLTKLQQVEDQIATLAGRTPVRRA